MTPDLLQHDILKDFQKIYFSAEQISALGVFLVVFSTYVIIHVKMFDVNVSVIVSVKVIFKRINQKKVSMQQS